MLLLFKSSAIFKHLKEDEIEELDDLLLILKNETEFLNYRNPKINFQYTEDFVRGRFTPIIANFVMLYLRAQKEFYSESAEIANAGRQTKLIELENELGKDGLYHLQKDYYNEKLAEIV